MVVRNTRSLKKKLGDILVDVGIITQDQLRQALEIQRARGGKLGAILQELRFCSEEVLLAFLGRQCGVSYVSISEYGKIPPEVIRLVPESVVRSQSLIPLSCEDNILTIAMSDPLNVFATDDLKQITGCDIKVVIASPQEILDTIGAYYGKGPVIAAASDNVSAAEQSAPMSGVQAIDPSLEEVLRAAIESGASDILFERKDGAVRVQFRGNGHSWREARGLGVPPERAIKKIRGLAGWSEGNGRDEGRIKVSIDGRDTIFRINLLSTSSGWEAHAHYLDPMRVNPDLSCLGMDKTVHDDVKLFLDNARGVLLLSGPSGSGLTTTYYSLLACLAKRNRRLLSVESPIEFDLPEAHQVDMPRANRLSGIGLMHQSPDVVAFSDMDAAQETAALLDGVSGGAFGLASLQARSAAEALAHFLQIAGTGGWSASLVEGVLFQKLVRTLCPKCKLKTTATEDVEGLMHPPDQAPELYAPSGCDQCGRSGYDGRTAVFEFSRITETLRKRIVRGATSAELEEILAQGGRRSIRQAALAKAVAGITSLEEARGAAI